MNVGSPQSAIAPAILELFRTALMPDRAYIDRVKKHYELFRASIDAAPRMKKAGTKRKK